MIKKKRIAIISCLDTKGENVLYLSNILNKFGCKPFIIDVGTRKQSLIKPEVNVIDIAKKAGYIWSYPIKNLSKHEIIDIIRKGISILVPEIFSKGLFDAVISIGGLQNTLIGVSAMKTLPIGIPKIMVSTMATGKRSFELIVDHSDIIPFNSIADFSGRNVITDSVLKNAASAIVGMVKNAGESLRFSEGLLVGMTTMGVVNKGSEDVLNRLKLKGCNVVSFHSTGVGGKMLDKFVENGVIKATVEFSLHEIVGEIFDCYSSGADKRLIASCEAGIPQLIVPGGCDFIDLEVSKIDREMFERKHIFHNSEIVHLKLLKNEITAVSNLLVSRLNKAKGPVRVMIPLKGFREGAGEGEPLYDPEIDNILINFLSTKLKPEIKVIKIDANINDEKFSTAVAENMYEMLKDSNLLSR